MTLYSVYLLQSWFMSVQIVSETAVLCISFHSRHSRLQPVLLPLPFSLLNLLFTLQTPLVFSYFTNVRTDMGPDSPSPSTPVRHVDRSLSSKYPLLSLFITKVKHSTPYLVSVVSIGSLVWRDVSDTYVP